jgi:phytoene synthase
MIRGCEMDLDQTRYESFEELESYMRGVACSVGTLSVAIFGTTHTPPDRVKEFVRLFGYAFQLTNIIRDVGPDLEMGRVYLPESEMREAGYSREALVRREHNPAFDRLMGSLYRRARGYYQQGRNMVDFRDRPGLLPAEIMAHIYEGILEEIKQEGFRVLFHRTTLPAWQKLRLAFRAWLYSHGIH